MPLVWEIMSEQLYFLNIAFNVQIHAFVLMSNHFHLLISTPEANLSAAMAVFMRETSRAITKSAHRINNTYGQRFSRTIIGSNHYFLHAYKYVYRNPVKAGLCDRVETYPYSTLNGLLGLSHLLIPIAEDTTLFSDLEGTLNWLNREPSGKSWDAVRHALMKAEFKLAKDRDTKKPHALEANAL